MTLLFLMNRKGDFCRYQVDYCSDNRAEYIERTNEAYTQAMFLLETEGAMIPPSNHTRLRFVEVLPV